jgi:hypothetical protein
MQLEASYGVVVTDKLTECRDFHPSHRAGGPTSLSRQPCEG